MRPSATGTAVLASTPAAAPRRSPGLDAVRALAVIAMVFGHTADGLLSDVARAHPAVQTYWTFRGLTAPLFLFVAGWAVMASVERSKISGRELFRARLPRVLLLLAFGYGLRFPGWDLHGLATLRHEPWAQLLGFDALHCIAISLLWAVTLLALVQRPVTRVMVFGALAVVIPLASGALMAAARAHALPLFLRQPLVADASSPFPLLPWAGYFFAGAFCGQLLARVSRGQLVRAVAMLLCGLAAAAISNWLGARFGAGDPQTSPALFGSRLGQVLMLAAAGMSLPMGIARRLAVLGRSSLVVYVVHLPIVYGWCWWSGLNARIGHSLSVPQVALLAAVLLGVGLAVAEAIRAYKKRRVITVVPIARSR